MENWRAGVEVLVLWILIYQTYRVFRATRGARILVGLTVVIILMTLASQILDLKVIEWIIKSAAAVLAFALLIIFQQISSPDSIIMSSYAAISISSPFSPSSAS